MISQQARPLPIDTQPASAFDAIADPLILVMCGVTIGFTMCTLMRQSLRANAFEQLLDEKLAERERERFGAFTNATH